MQVFAPYEPNLKKIKRRQAMRFGVPVLAFLLLMALLMAAVYYAQQDERDQFIAGPDERFTDLLIHSPGLKLEPAQPKFC